LSNTVLYYRGKKGMNEEKSIKKSYHWFIAIITVLFTGLLAFINLSEFIKIYIFKKTENYPFGGEGSTPWYYDSAESYAIVCLVSGIMFLILLGLSIWFTLKSRKGALSVCAIFALIIFFIFHFL